MPETAVADTGPLLHLHEIDHLATVSVSARLAISQHVSAELRRHRVLDAVALQVADGLQRLRVTLAELKRQSDKLSECGLHQADLSTAALAERLKPDVVLTDDLRLRRGLENCGYLVVGCVGVLVRAYRKGMLNRNELDLALDRLFDDSSLYTSSAFRDRVRTLIERDGLI